MRLLVGKWFDHAIAYREPPDDEVDRQRHRYQEATRRLEDGIAAAQLVLPIKIAKRLTGLTREMAATRQGQDYVGELDELYGVIDRSLTELIADGRQILGIDPVAPLEPPNTIP